MTHFQQCTLIFERQTKKIKHNNKISVEWKEAARRIDIILFFISSVIIIFTPVYYFGPYLFKDTDLLNHSCGCNVK
jgi:hypothetical protein